jgi:hypothetical protein
LEPDEDYFASKDRFSRRVEMLFGRAGKPFDEMHLGELKTRLSVAAKAYSDNGGKLPRLPFFDKMIAQARASLKEL